MEIEQGTLEYLYQSSPASRTALILNTHSTFQQITALPTNIF